MNKTQKKQVEDYLKLLGKAHDEVRKAIDIKKYDVAMNLLEQCQDAAIELGNMIESVEGEDFITIPLLENYCELTYQIYEEIWQKHFVSVNKVYRNLQNSLIQIDNSVKNDVKVRMEAVFLPYKASMWDSLESVWKAADEDPDCDAYVIPIPYYDRNQDGSFGEMHYEGEEYPDYVPVTWYEEYDFASHQPDMIFIHNPYDENNYVTSVHPFFYSKNLKQYTKKLIYIPYFLLDEVNPEDIQAIENMAHFCSCSGVINADKVVVQSEAMRQIYIKVMTDLTGKNTKRYWERKILGLGSPKIDKVLSIGKGNLEIPKEWQNVIEKPDGNWKKIVFYNTGITALLQTNERFIRKLKDVLHVFWENKEDVALLWRPHPLMKTTLESMRPELREEYEEIVEKYCKEGWGIYDDTADLDRAIVVCDMYYGDESSVVKLCQEVKKPVMIQELWRVKIEDWLKRIRISNDVVIDGMDLWLVSNYTNILMNYDINEGNLKQIYYFPEKFTNTYSTISYVKVEDKIYFAPYNGKNLWCFHIPTKEFKRIDLRLENKEKNIKQKFRGIIHYSNELILIGFGIHAIFRIDIASNTVKRFDEYLKELEKRGIRADKSLLGFSYQLVGDVLYLPMLNHNMVIAFYLMGNHFKIYDIFHLESDGFDSIEYYDGKFRLFTSGDEEVIWDCEQGQISKIKLNLMGANKRNYWKIFQINNTVIYFPMFDPQIYAKNKEGNLEALSFLYPEPELFSDGSKYEFIKENNGKIYFQVRSNGDCYYIDLHQMSIQPVKLKSPDDDTYGQILKKIFTEIESEKLYESEIVNITNYLYFLEHYQQKNVDKDKRCGEMIYRSLK